MSSSKRLAMIRRGEPGGLDGTTPNGCSWYVNGGGDHGQPKLHALPQLHYCHWCQSFESL